MFSFTTKKKFKLLSIKRQKYKILKCNFFYLLYIFILICDQSIALAIGMDTVVVVKDTLLILVPGSFKLYLNFYQKQIDR